MANGDDIPETSKSGGTLTGLSETSKQYIEGGVSFIRYLSPDKTLLARVDFLGLISDLVKGAIAVLISALAAMVIGTRRAFGDIATSIETGMWDVWETFSDGIEDAQTAAVDAAGEQLDVLGIFALPTSAVFSIAAVAVVGLAFYILVTGWLMD